MANHRCWHVAALATAWALAATCVLAQSSGNTGSCSPYGPRKDCGAPDASISACMHVSGGRRSHEAGGKACSPAICTRAADARQKVAAGRLCAWAPSALARAECVMAVIEGAFGARL